MNGQRRFTAVSTTRLCSYNTDLLVYVAIAFGETEIPEEQWQAIAKSVQIEPL